MKTPYLMPVALLMMAVSFGPASAHAEAPDRTQTFQVEFTYNASAPAENIYSDLRRTAHRACHKQLRTNTMQFQSANRACTRQVVDAGVKLLGRTDITMLHSGRIQTAAR